MSIRNKLIFQIVLKLNIRISHHHIRVLPSVSRDIIVRVNLHIQSIALDIALQSNIPSDNILDKIRAG